MTIQPIDTTYHGYKFRSRLEARWAVFLDALALSWQYEPEGFILTDGTRYLPDFRVKDIGWLEIKPERATSAEQGRLSGVVSGTETPGFLLMGNIPDPEETYLEVGPDPLFDIQAFWPMGGGAVVTDWGYWFCVCPICGKVGIEYQARSHRICGGRVHPELAGKDRGHNGNHLRIIDALSRARGARFEHGETP